VIAFKFYKCEKCGYSTWTMESIKKTKCLKCGNLVETKVQEKKADTISSFPGEFKNIKCSIKDSS